MKLAPKIALWMLALLGVLFALGAGAMIHQSFARNLDVALDQSVALHQQQKQAIRRQLAEAAYREDMVNVGTVAEAAAAAAAFATGQNDGCAVLAEGYTTLYNTLPVTFAKMEQVALVDAGGAEWQLWQQEGKSWLLVTSAFYAAGQPLWLISAFDVTHLYVERGLQTQTFFLIYGMVLAATLVAAVGLAVAITRPLRALNQASREIAAGDYARRTGIRRPDEIGELADSFDTMAAAVEQKIDLLALSVRQREDFMGAFTHELKTPMTAMMGYAALLQKDALGPQERQKALAYLHSETKRLEALSQKLLALFCLADAAPALGTVLLADWFGRVQGALAPDLGCAVVLPACVDGSVRGDADLLTALLLNLIQNGARAGPRDGQVRVEAEGKGDGYRIFVRDTGRGMAPQVVARLGEPFYRADTSRARADGGSGLGLALCGRIAALHGTALAFDSAPGRGTTVSFYLQGAAGPAEQEEEAAL